ncbi:putative autophagy-related protein 11 [Amylocarpus encephaloides]|uniref:Autophagy-related protein 11 n=1 Tax=Amylocarpus encephaloides TaxID=45428 RepID=A0A9P7YFY3_9HELO|nr:putative autophagy-related protein 11 [Amylocarpus encephaloides]
MEATAPTAGMPLRVLLAHTGHCLQTNPGSFASLEEFKNWVAKQSPIYAQYQILLTSQGEIVKLQMLSTEKEIYIYDRRILQSSSRSAAEASHIELPLPIKYSPNEVPEAATSNDLQSWRDVLMLRRTWALKVVDDCATMSADAQQRYNEAHVIALGVNAASFNLEKHVKALDLKYAGAQEWSKDFQKEQEAAGTDWDASINRLRSLPANSEMICFITGQNPPSSHTNATLEDLLDRKDLKKAGKIVRVVTSQINKNIAALGTKVDVILKTMDGLSDKVESNQTRSLLSHTSEPAGLLKDIEALARKVSNDYESVLGYSNSSKNLSETSRSAFLHPKNYLPTIQKRSLEMHGILHSATEARNSMALRSLDIIMHDISSLTALVFDADSQFAALNLDGDSVEAMHTLGMLNTLPATYASFLAEAVRRREWNEKIRLDSSTLTNEMATFRDEELRRRRKWQKAIGNTLWGDRLERKVMGLEINLHDDEEEWPQASRQDLEDMLNTLKTQEPQSPLVSSVSKILTELSNPTKQQSRRARAFKAGSIHEAALGRSALLVRGDDESLRGLQDEKQKLESKLRTAESRVRRLEDLYHQQSQVNRSSTGHIFQPQGHRSPDPLVTTNPLASPPRLHDDQSRRSSVSSRRFSAHQGADEKAFQQKLLSAEAEAIAEREKTAGLEKEISAHKTAANDMKAQIEEANSTKQDLLQNFEAQQGEFIAERKSLEDEIKRLNSKLEDNEDEMDRLLGSRENEKATVDDRVRDLQDELEKARRDHSAEIQKAQGQVDFLRNDAKLQRGTNETLESQLQKVKEENRELLSRIQDVETTAEKQLQVLQDTHTQLSPTSPIPMELPALAEVVVGLSGELVAELESLKNDVTVARSDRDTAKSEVAALKSEVDHTQERLTTEQNSTTQLRETLDSEQAKYKALEVAFAAERGQLANLRTQIADGVTGSESLRSRLEAEERKVTSMSEDLARRQSRIGGHEEEMRALQGKHDLLQNKYEKLTSRFDSRTSRAKDLTQRAYAQDDRLCRLLERLSYSVTREGKTMAIQRLPKPDRTNANDSSDPGSSMRKSITGAITRKTMVDSGDLDLLYWMHNDDPETESEKYDAYLNSIGSFDVEKFCDVLTKRIKDVEYTAKKYSKAAQAYKEKSRVAQKEAHEKIAFKHFKEGDLGLFLPTRNQATGAWAAFNVGAPHYFLREQDSHKLRSRDWLLARIHKIEDRVVDLSKSMSQSSHINAGDGRSLNGSFEDDNPFELSDGLRWYLIHASEEKPGAPTTPGLGKSTVASAHVDATGSIRHSKKSSSGGVEGLNKTLSKSLDSRRSSSNSKKTIPVASPLIKTGSTATDTASTTGIQSPAGEPSGAQLVRRGSRHEGNSNGDRGPSSEVRGQIIDNLLGP